MNEKIKKIIMQQPILAAFVGIEAIFYIAFLFLDIIEVPTTQIKYMSICFCVAMSIYLLVSQKSYMICCIMFLTLIADTFLLLLNNYYVIGVMAFCIVQTMYAGVLILQSDWKSVIPRLAMYGITVLVLYRIRILDLLTALAGWSFIQLTVNVIHAFLIHKNIVKRKLLAVGLLLFWSCDICVGIHNLMAYVPQFPFPRVVLLAAFGMWLFYLPSQVLIVLSFCSDIEKSPIKEFDNK